MATDANARARRRRREQAIDFLLKNDDGDRSQAHRRALDAWLASDPENAAAYDEVRKLMGDARSAILEDPALATLEPKKRNSGRRTAGIMVIAAAIALGSFFELDGPLWLQADVISGTGEMPTLTLADGSTMQLNASSAAAYDFDGHRRTVRLLRGEAYFEVVSDPQRPFAVEAAGSRTTALGTAFNIRLYGDDADVTVIEHAVEVASLGHIPSSVRLDAGHAVACCADGRVGAVQPADPAVTLAWRRGQLVVDNATLESVVAAIRRHFSGRIIIASDELAQRRVSGTFTVSDPETALELLRTSLGIEITRLGPLVVIRG